MFNPFSSLSLDIPHSANVHTWSLHIRCSFFCPIGAAPPCFDHCVMSDYYHKARSVYVRSNRVPSSEVDPSTPHVFWVAPTNEKKPGGTLSLYQNAVRPTWMGLKSFLIPQLTRFSEFERSDRTGLDAWLRGNSSDLARWTGS